jgi:hypothetical protein
MDNFSPQGPVMSLDVTQGDEIIAPMPGFPIDFSATLKQPPAHQFVQTADIDGDGKHEIFVATTPHPQNDGMVDSSYLFAVHQDGSRVLQNGYADPVVAVIAGGISGAPLICDYDKDGIFEIVLRQDFGHNNRDGIVILKAQDKNGDGLFDLVARFDFPASNPFVTKGKLCFGVHSNAGDSLYVLSNIVEKFPSFASNYAAWDKDNTYLSSGEILAEIIKTPRIFSGNLIEHVSLSGSNPFGLNCISSDINGDGALEGIALLQNRLDVLQMQSANPAPIVAVQNPLILGPTAGVSNKLASADVDGDGRNDILIANEAKLIVLNYALSAVDYYPVQGKIRYALAASFPGEAQDAIFTVGSDKLSQLGTKAQQADGFPIPLPGNASVVLLPIAGTTGATMGVAVAGDDGRLNLYNTSNSVDANSFKWRSIYADELNSNLAPASTHKGAAASAFFPQERCYNWPNPTYEKQTKIRYFVSTDATVSVKIYDLAGEKVDELHSNAMGGTDNEIAWDVSKMQSGVYLAHVEVTGKGGSGEKIIKVAVVK